MNGKGAPEKLYDLIRIDDGAQEEEDDDDDGFAYRPGGYGCQDIHSILEACKKACTSWVVVEHDQPSMNKTPLESIKMSIDYIKTINK